MKAHDLDFRRRVMQAIDAGMPLRRAAREFGVDASTITRWRQRRDRKGDFAPLGHRGRRALLRGYEVWLADYLASNPYASAAQVHAALKRAGATASYATVRRYMAKQGWRSGLQGMTTDSLLA